MKNVFKAILDFLLFAIINVIVTYITIEYLSKYNPYSFLGLLFLPYGAVISGLIGMLISLKWKPKFISKLVIAVLIVLPSYIIMALLMKYL